MGECESAYDGLWTDLCINNRCNWIQVVCLGAYAEPDDCVGCQGTGSACKTVQLCSMYEDKGDMRRALL